LTSTYYSTTWKKTSAGRVAALYFGTDPDVKMIFSVYAEFLKENGTSDRTAVEKLGIGGEVARRVASKPLGVFRRPVAAFCRFDNSASTFPTTKCVRRDVG